MNKHNEEYGPKVTRERFEAALRGARIAGPKHKESVTPKRKRKQSKKQKKD